MKRTMNLLRNSLIVAAALISGADLYGQSRRPPQPQTQASPGVDISGYWTPPMDEDALERGAGSELGDYAGFALNEAGRLWALSYDPSRLTDRYHQCDAYVTAYQMRAVGNLRIWEERDPHNQHLIAIHWWAQTTEGHRVIWMDGRPHPPAWAPHSFTGFSTGQFVGNALVVVYHAHEAGLAAAQRHAGKRSGHRDGVLRPPRRPSHQHDGGHRSRVSNRAGSPQQRLLPQSSDHHSWLYACDDGEQIVGRAPDGVPNYLFGKQPFAKEFAKKYKLPLIAGMGGAGIDVSGVRREAQESRPTRKLWPFCNRRPASRPKRARQ